MKKTLALLLALALVFSSITVAFAEETISADAKAVSSLGMLVGSGDGVTSAYLATTPNRIQAAIMVLRLKGLEQAAKDFKGTDNFADAKDAEWAAPIMAYLKANKELGWIGDGTNFNPNGKMDVKSYYKVMLETLGYKQNTADVIGDFTYPNVLNFAAEKGLKAVATVTNFTVNDLATATVETLKATVNGSTTKTLAASLVDSKVITVEKAVAAGVYTAPVVAPAVASISMNNLLSLTVNFGKEVDKDTITTSTVKLYKNGSTTALSGLTASSFSLAADKKTLIVVLPSSLAQSDSLKVVVDGVKTTDKVAVDKYENTITVVDTTAPVITDVTATTSTTIDVTFSEPMNIAAAAKVWDEIYIDGVKTYANIATGSLATKNRVTLNLATKLSVGQHSYKITSFRDWAGFALATKEGSITISSDTTAPSIASAVVSKNNEITVTFDEPVNQATIAIGSANFTATEAGGSAIQLSGVTNTAGDNKTYELALVTALTPAAIVNVELSYKNVADLEGNTVTTAKTFSLKAADDIVRPTVTATVDATNNTIALVYSEKMDDTSAKLNTNYKLYKDGSQVATTISVATTGSDTTSTKYTVSFSNGATLSGAYVLRINNVKDASIRANMIAVDTDVAVTLADTKTPSIVSASATKEYKDADSDGKVDSLKIVIPFDESMDSTTALNLSNYIVKFGSNADIVASTITDAKIAFGADNKTVVITLPGTEDTATTVKIAGLTVTHGSDAVVVKVLGVKDVAGNVLTASQINAVITTTSFNSAGMTLSSVKAVGKNKIEIKSATPFASIDPNGIRFTGGTTTTDIAQQIVVAGIAFSTDMKTATLTLSASLTADGKYDIDETAVTTVQDLKLVTISDTAIVNNLGQNVAKGTYDAALPNAFTVGGAATYTVADYIAPSLIATNPIVVTGSTDTIRVTFDEALDLAAADTARLAAIANDLTVKVDGVELDPSVGEYVVLADTDDDATFAIKILKDGVVATDNVSVKLNNGRYVFDLANGTLATVFDTKIKTGDLVTELVAPIATPTWDVNADTKVVKIAFSEAMDASTLVAANFTSAAGGAITNFVVASDNKSVTITFTTGLVATNNVAINAAVTDKAGNARATATVTHP